MLEAGITIRPVELQTRSWLQRRRSRDEVVHGIHLGSGILPEIRSRTSKTFVRKDPMGTECHEETVVQSCQD